MSTAAASVRRYVTNQFSECVRRKGTRNATAARPETNETTNPAARMSGALNSSAALRASRERFQAGTEDHRRREEERVPRRSSRRMSRKSPAEIVMPERLTPGSASLVTLSHTGDRGRERTD